MAAGACRQAERHRLVVGVEEDEEAIVDDRLASLIRRGNALAAEEDADAAGKSVLPIVVGHLAAVGLEPADVADVNTAQRTAIEPAPALKDGMLAAERDHARGEGEETVVDVLPIEP